MNSSPSSAPAPAAREDWLNLVLYFSLAFGLSWALHLSIPLFHLPFTRDLTSAGQVAYIVGIAGPCAAALITTGLRGGTRGLRELLAPFTRWRFPLRYWLLTLGAVGVIRAAGVGISMALGGQAPEHWFNVSPGMLLVLVGQQLYVMLGEEIGWRGFAMPRLVARLGWVGGTFVLGVLWASWHLPMFLVPGSSQHGTSFPGYLVVVVSWTFLMAFLWSRTRSLLAPMLFHGALNLWAFTTSLPEEAQPITRIVYAIVVVMIAVQLPRPAFRPAPLSASGESASAMDPA